MKTCGLHIGFITVILKKKCVMRWICFLKVLNSLSLYFLYDRYWFLNFLLLFRGDQQNQSFTLLLWIHLIIIKILPETFPTNLVAAYRDPPKTLKRFPKSACDSENLIWKLPKTCTSTLEKIYQWGKMKTGTEIVMRLLENFLELGTVSVFIRSRNFIFIFQR